MTTNTDDARAEAERRYRGPRTHVGTATDREIAAYVDGWQDGAAGRAETTTEDLVAELLGHRVERIGGRCACGDRVSCPTDENIVRHSVEALADAGLLATARTCPSVSDDARAEATKHRCGEWRLDKHGACVHCGEKPPIIELADAFTGGDPANDLSILLMRTWGRVDPSSAVAQHPDSYVATFYDMARATLAAARAETTTATTEDADANVTERAAQIAAEHHPCTGWPECCRCGERCPKPAELTEWWRSHLAAAGLLATASPFLAETEWGVRYSNGDLGGYTEKQARRIARKQQRPLVRREVGPWTEADQ